MEPFARAPGHLRPTHKSFACNRSTLPSPKLPIHPIPARNHGCPHVSIGRMQLAARRAGRAEAAGGSPSVSCRVAVKSGERVEKAGEGVDGGTARGNLGEEGRWVERVKARAGLEAA